MRVLVDNGMTQDTAMTFWDASTFLQRLTGATGVWSLA